MEVRGFDCNTPLSLNIARKLKDLKFNFAIRYVGRNSMADYDISIEEKDAILYAGLDLGIVQHCPLKGDLPVSKDLGKKWGINAREFSKAVEYEKGCVVYLDLEDVNIEYANDQQSIYDYCNYWYEEVSKYYQAGIYIGFNNFMTSEQLYRYLKFQTYWKSLSWVPDVYKRGYAMFQYPYGTKFGIDLDLNILKGDNLGGCPKFMKGRVDPVEVEREKVRDLLSNELDLTFDYWDGIKYFPNLLDKLGSLFKKWGKIK